MPEFCLEGRDSLNFRELPDIARGFIEALFFTAERPEESGYDVGGKCPNCGATLEEGEDSAPFCPAYVCDWNCGAIPDSYGFPDLSPVALDKIKADCAAFESANRRAIAALAGSFDGEQIGRDFWFTRNGHGVGFWDRTPNGKREARALAKLDAAARAFDSLDAYRGDDSRVYLA